MTHSTACAEFQRRRRLDATSIEASCVSRRRPRCGFAFRPCINQRPTLGVTSYFSPPADGAAGEGGGAARGGAGRRQRAVRYARPRAARRRHHREQRRRVQPVLASLTLDISRSHLVLRRVEVKELGNTFCSRPTWKLEKGTPRHVGSGPLRCDLFWDLFPCSHETNGVVR